MPAATQLITSFLGGEISGFAQGRFDRPDYRTSMRTCLNSFPIEIGAWTRRPGTNYSGHTRRGAPGRVIKFDFEQAASVTLELVDGYMRFRSGPVLIQTNDQTTIISISTGMPNGRPEPPVGTGSWPVAGRSSAHWSAGVWRIGLVQARHAPSGSPV